VIEATEKLPGLAASTAQARHRASENSIGFSLVAVARWLVLASLVFAPWAYGATRPWAAELLNYTLFLATLIGACGFLARWSPPQIHPVLGFALTLLLLQGWWMTLNAGFSYDATLQPHARPNWNPKLPGAVDYAVALPAMTGLTALIGALALAADMGTSRRWRKRIWLTMALTGCSIIVLGLAQKLTQAPGIFWQAEGHAPSFFATYRYHANAGSFINIVWPLMAAALAVSIRRQEPLARRAFWTACFVLAMAGALANTSRASGLIAVGLLGAWVAWLGIRRWRQRADTSDPAAFVGIALVLVAVIIGVLAAGGLDRTLRRWQHFDNEMRLENARLMAARVCVDMLPQSGWLGFGPGTFPTAFPFFNKDTTDATRGIWLQAHQDYLQTVVEWGWIGAAGWAVVIAGGLGLAAWRGSRHQWSSKDRFFQLGASAAIVAVLLHSLVDFPLQIASLQLYVAVLLGLLWSCRRWQER
jgi:hypothetical protein